MIDALIWILEIAVIPFAVGYVIGCLVDWGKS